MNATQDEPSWPQPTRGSRHARHLAVLLLSLVVALGCGSDSGGDSNSDVDDDGTAETTPGATAPEVTVRDITNAILSATSGDCADYADDYLSTVRDINRSMSFSGELSITVTGEHCIFASNAIPNHDFNDGDRTFVNAARAQSISYRVPRAPVAATETTPLSLQTDNAVFLNGVKLDLLAAGCFGVGDGKIGCFDMGRPFRYDPMSETADFGTDSHNAHTQPDGTYHYHGNPRALFADDDSDVSPVIGFAADGFPIFGSYVRLDDTIRKAASSYRLKSGSRTASGGVSPGGTFDGTFVDDYEYVAGSGDLDECNGMRVDGVYGYFVTDSYPWVMACFRGTPDASFNK